jgi:hypothetical protein
MVAAVTISRKMGKIKSKVATTMAITAIVKSIKTQRTMKIEIEVLKLRIEGQHIMIVYHRQNRMSNEEESERRNINSYSNQQGVKKYITYLGLFDTGCWLLNQQGHCTSHFIQHTLF